MASMGTARFMNAWAINPLSALHAGMERVPFFVEIFEVQLLFTVVLSYYSIVDIRNTSVILSIMQTHLQLFNLGVVLALTSFQ